MAENSKKCPDPTERRRVPRESRPHEKPSLQKYRTKLRKSLTPAEASLWRSLKGSALDGRKFRRQHSVGRYILDFYCCSERLAVELDGEVHFNPAAAEYDQKRKEYLNQFGIKVIRFENKLVFEAREYLLDWIRSNFGWWKQ